MKIKKKSNAVRVPPVQKAIRIKRKSTDTTEESTLSKAIENFKKVFEEKKDKPIRIISAPKDVVLPKIVKSTRKINKVPDVTPKGLIYIGHIPHGFYEDEMKEYFSQFGKVTRVRVARSKNTGKSRGYGYVEFLHPDVAKVAAETMNNYLMCGRLLKAICIPPEKQHGRHFLGKPWSINKYPKKINRQKVIKSRNGIIDDNEHRNFVKSTLAKLSNLEKKLKAEGIEIDFKSIVKYD